MGHSRKKQGGIAETVKTIFYAAIIALLVRSVAFEPFSIPSGSMIPTLLVGDYLFVSKYSYGYSRYSLPFGPNLFEGRILASPPERGDVAVFKLPTDDSTDYIKRVIGLPGDRIQVTRGQLYINDQLVERRQIEDYVYRDGRGNLRRQKRYIETLPNGRSHIILLNPDTETRRAYAALGINYIDPDNTGIYVVPENAYFMMGDNRDDSQDSRYLAQVGYVPFENLVGRAEIVWFSIDDSASFWEVWKWPGAIRWDRFFTVIE
ncbi:MAG: signal peptidase I [Rhodospirillaceae bacterium]|nr:signal peptidase I [Rhodospirillaceae bacterium]